jgi:hypothetical protein
VATEVKFSDKWMGTIGAFLAIMVSIVVAAQTLLPYFYTIPDSSAATIGQQQTMFQTVFLMVISFFFGASAGSRAKDTTIGTLADTAKSAQAALTPDASIPIAPGEKKTIEGKEP